MNKEMVEKLLHEIHDSLPAAGQCWRRSSSFDSDSTSSDAPHFLLLRHNIIQLRAKGIGELESLRYHLRGHVFRLSGLLVQQLKLRERLRTKRDFKYDVITASLQAMSPKRRSALRNLGVRRRSSEARGVDTRMRFSLEPSPRGDSGYTQWRDAMKMVARLPGGIPIEFRKRLWVTLAEAHIKKRGIDWPTAHRTCLNERSNPDDDKLGIQIVKDLHRTGCSLFSASEPDAEQNQALLKKVLLAYARWNKSVGYCQGFNMLAAIILEVMDWQEEEALKVMIFLIEGVLPESYFANHLRGLSVDMATFRDLLHLRLPVLSGHLERLQSSNGSSYEPPLINVFTMQWFLTLFSNCLPKAVVLRVWDLIFLEGNEILLRTALCVWEKLAARVMAVESADEFYCIMGVLTREMLEFGLMDANDLVRTICTLAPFPFPRLVELRDRYAYNIRPLTTSRRRLLRQVDEEDDEDHLAMATWCLSNAFPPPKLKGDSGTSGIFSAISPGALSVGVPSFPSPSSSNVDAERTSLDISHLKQQYKKLRERQKQAHIILTGAFHHQVGTRERTHVAVNHLLAGKKPLVCKSRQKPTSFAFRDSPAVPQQRCVKRLPVGETLSWQQVKREVKREEEDEDSSSSTSTELCDDDVPSDAEEQPQNSCKESATTYKNQNPFPTARKVKLCRQLENNAVPAGK